MNDSNSTKLTKIISNLGGPSIANTDIEWALDLPAGKKLVDWLAAQLGDRDGEQDDTVDGENEYIEALHAIALEAGEVDILKHIGPPGVNDTGDVGTFPLGYLPPSRLKKQAEHLNTEIHFWEEEAQLLKMRLKQTKLASEKMVQSAKSLQAAIEKETSDIAQQQDRLADLSLYGDSAISSTVKGALSLLDALGWNSHPDSNMKECGPSDTKIVSNLAAAVKTLSSLASLRTSIIDLHTLQVERLDEACLKIPSLDVIKADAAQLQDTLTPQFHESASEAAFLQELEDTCKLLESANMNDTTLLQILDVNTRPDAKLHQDFDVNDALETAWSLDQATILDARGKILEMTISAYNNDLVEPLRVLQQSLSTIEKRARDSEALIGALGVELEEVVDDVRSSKENSEVTQPNSIEDSLDDDLETKLLVLLKDLKDLRPSDASPLVLLQRADIIRELASLVHRTEALQERESALSERLPLALSAMKSMHAPLLSQVYEHSPVNTSPAFSLPSDIAQLQDKAKFKGDDLANNVGRLQKELDSLMGSGRTKRKLGAFTDKWCKPT